MVMKRNWRDVTPILGHQDAVVWDVLHSVGAKERFPESSCLLRIGTVGHLELQGGGKVSKYHTHENVEQVFIFLEGSGKMRINDVLYPVEDGDFVYAPAGLPHQVINEGKDWIEYLIISGRVEKPEEKPEVVKRNWREVTPVLGHQDAIVWNVLRSVEAKERFPEGACLRGLSGTAWMRLQGLGKVSIYHSHEDVEQVFGIVKGCGRMRLDNVDTPVVEGDFVHVPPGVSHQVINDGLEWLDYLIISGRVEK